MADWLTMKYTGLQCCLTQRLQLEAPVKMVPRRINLKKNRLGIGYTSFLDNTLKARFRHIFKKPSYLPAWIILKN